MIKNGIIAGLKPDEIRDMLPKDAWLVFKGWSEAHSPKSVGDNAMNRQQYRDLVERIDGN